MRSSFALVLLAAALFAGSAPVRAQKMMLAEGLTPGAVRVGRMTRHFYIHIPRQLKGKRAPVVLILHGGGPRAEAIGVAWRVKFDNFADRESFVTVYPNGIGNTWNDAREAPFERELPARDAKDVEFLTTLIDHLIGIGIADKQRIYVTGASNGGMMTMTLACAAAEKLAAIAPLIASAPVELKDTCRFAKPLPVMMINGTEDKLIPWSGGAVVATLPQDRGKVLSIGDSLALWRGLNKCEGDPATRQLPDRDPNDGTRASRTDWACADGTAVSLIRIDGGGHAWPGTDDSRWPARIKKFIGRPSRDFDVREVIWTFFKGFRR